MSKTPWLQYSSLNTGKESITNTEERIGLLPESGVYNRKMSDLTTWISDKKTEGYSMVEDFRINPGSDGFFTIFPFYYGTNLQHELGVYLLDDDFNPILRNGGSATSNNYNLSDFISFPIFKTRDHGDLQVQPHYDSNITGIKLEYPGMDEGKKLLKLDVGKTYDLQKYIKIQLNNSSEWISYADDDLSTNDYLSTYGATTHSRVTYHAWVDEANSASDKKPVVYATCTRDGKLTTVACTKGHGDNADNGYKGSTPLCIAIANQVKNGESGKAQIFGVRYEVSISIVPEGDKTYEVGFDESNLPDKVYVDTDNGNKRLNIPSTYNGILPIIVKEDGTEITGWTTDDFEIEQYENYSPFIVEAASNKSQFNVRTQSYTDDTQWVHLKYKVNGYQVYDFAFPIKVYEDYVTHTWTGSYTGLPSGLTYSNYVQTVTTDEIINLSNETKSLVWDWEKTLSVNPNPIIKAGDKVRITFNGGSSKNEFKLVNKNGDWHETEYMDIGSNTSKEIELNETWAGYFGSDPWYIIGGGTVNSVDLIIKDGGDRFKSALAKEDIISYYRTNNIGGTSRENDSYTLYSTDTDTDISVNITDESQTNFAYTVTLSKRVLATSAPKRHKANKQKSNLSRALPSEGGFDMSALLVEEAGKWVDVNSYFTRYLRAGEEVSSYPVDMDMLGRTRGYDVYIKDKDGNPYTGYLGVYLKILGSNDLKQDGNWEEYVDNSTSYTVFNETDQYVVFSQRRFNRDENKALYPQISAMSVIHPSSGDTFLSFEDMRVTHAGPGETGGYDYSYWEKSSDRDVNDVVFKIYGVDDISNDSGSLGEKIYDDGFPWIWAVEDLGATDDFDFNDLVVKITSLTTKVKTPVTVGNTTTDTYSVLSKVVTFTPLAAGGTLPLFIHLKNGDDDYVLYPGGVFNITGDANFTVEDVTFDNNNLLSSESDEQEIHKWFGNGNFATTEMINTGKGPSNQKAKTCTLYVKAPTCDESSGELNSDGFQINIFSDGKTIDNANAQLNTVHFYVTVYHNGKSESESNIYHERLSIENPVLGAAPQSFIIKADNWVWPTERQNIIDKYPKFGEWINNASYDWINNK